MLLAAFLGEECCWQPLYLFYKGMTDAFWDELIVKSLESAAPLLVLWQYCEAYSSQLVI